MIKLHFIYFDINTGYYPGFHHGLAYLFGMLKRDKHRVVLSHLTDEDQLVTTAETLKKNPPDLIALSFTTNQKKYVKAFLQHDMPSGSLIISGGVHCTLTGKEFIEECPQVDGVCVGEGDFPLIELCHKLENNLDYTSTAGFVFRAKSGIVENLVPKASKIDSLALPDYSLFDYEKIISDSGQCFQMMLSRGCPYSCVYCCNHAVRQVYPNQNEYVRFASVQRAMEIIKNNLLLYPDAKKIIFADDTFTLNKNWLSNFCREYKEEINLPFLCNARVETINEEIVKCLKSAGCVSIDFGVESGSEWLRKNILNRKHSNEQIRNAFQTTKKYGLQRFAYCMVALPFETEQMAAETLRLNMQLRPNFGKCFYFYPYPKTKIYQLCEDYDLLLDDRESVSGYLEGPSLKSIFMPYKKMKRHFDSLQLFFYSRLIFAKIKIPLFLEKILIKILIIFRKPVLAFLDPITQKTFLVRLRRFMRRLAMKHLR